MLYNYPSQLDSIILCIVEAEGVGDCSVRRARDSWSVSIGTRRQNSLVADAGVKKPTN